QAESGLASVTGGPDAPARVGVSVCDIAAGMNAYEAILAALYAREHTGEGAAISISMFDAMAEWMAVPLIQYQGGAPPKRMGLAPAWGSARPVLHQARPTARSRSAAPWS